MQFISVFGSLALAIIALADSQSFGLVLIRSGSSYQYATIGVSNGQLEVVSSDYITATITDDGKLSLGDGTFAVVKFDGIYSGADGSAPFSISGGYLEYKSAGFTLSSDYALLAGADGPNPVAVRATLNSGTAAADFTPSSTSSNSSSTSSISTSSSTSTTPEVMTQSVNGGSKAGVCAGIAAVAAALLL